MKDTIKVLYEGRDMSRIVRVPGISLRAAMTVADEQNVAVGTGLGDDFDIKVMMLEGREGNSNYG
jgi:hypothetical protein